MKSPNAIFETQDSLVREQLVTLGETLQFVVSPRLFDIWTHVLRNVPLPQLEAAFAKLHETWKPEYGRKFPAPGDVMAIVHAARTLAQSEAIEKKWQETMAALVANFHPDFGWRGPLLEPSVRRGLEAAGGMNHVWNASPEQRIWAKKAFVESLLREDTLEEYRSAGLLPMETNAQLTE